MSWYPSIRYLFIQFVNSLQLYGGSVMIGVGVGVVFVRLKRLTHDERHAVQRNPAFRSWRAPTFGAYFCNMLIYDFHYCIYCPTFAVEGVSRMGVGRCCWNGAAEMVKARGDRLVWCLHGRTVRRTLHPCKHHITDYTRNTPVNFRMGRRDLNTIKLKSSHIICNCLRVSIQHPKLNL